ncbi:MAG: L-asparaginase [Magnetovibrio sp.]|nr:L-asparaginase [Magnetovibrio sp.]|tara:strand:+ start:404 stop:1402 length:999 start_codon:yes stop_codon:yes gene_type:complete
MSKPRVVVIGTGGTISSVGKNSLDLVEYSANNKIYNVDELLEVFPETRKQAEVVPVNLRNIPSTAVGPTEWLEINAKIHEMVAQDPGLDGIVITHGTATLEETAYFLNLVVKVDIPIVLVGAQRPASGIGTDAGINLVNAIRTAGDPNSKGRGVLGLLNDEIHFSRDMTKTATLRQHTFKSPDFGVLGHADWDRIVYYRMPERRRAPDTEFDVRGVRKLPPVEILMSYAGSKGVAIDAFVESGTQGIVIGTMAPGYVTPKEFEKLEAVAEKGITIVYSTRAGTGRVANVPSRRIAGTILADNLTPQKSRVLLSVALTKTDDPIELQRIFDNY